MVCCPEALLEMVWVTRGWRRLACACVGIMLKIMKYKSHSRFSMQRICASSGGVPECLSLKPAADLTLGASS